MALQPGDRAPDAVLPDHSLQKVSLADVYASGPTVLVFVPLAFSSTCTEELCAFRDDEAELRALGGQVVALSIDSPYVLKRFREDIGADYPFLSDFNREAMTAFGVLREAPVGPGLLGASERAVFVIDRDGVVRYTWVGAHPGLLPPYDEVRAALAAL